jgi:hypothetical protein
MRIVLSCLQSLRHHDIPAYGFWRTYFVEGCREAGMEVLEVPGVDWAEGLTYAEESEELDAWRSRTWEKTVAFARDEQEREGVDFFLGYLYPDQVEVSAVRELQRVGIPCVNFFCDNVREFRKVPATYAAFDLHWVPEYEALAMYRRSRLPHIHAPMPCWVPEHLRNVPEHETEPATFIGSSDILRWGLLGEALADGADLTLRGPGWGESGQQSPVAASHGKSNSVLANQFALLKRHGLVALGAKIANAVYPLRPITIPQERVAPAVFGDEYFRVTREAAVTVGVNRVPVTRRPLYSPLKYSRLRDIEAPMLGACYLTEQTEGLAGLYDLGEEIETYTSGDELADKLKALLANPQKRSSLRLAGQQKALREHSVAASLGKIVERLGIPEKRSASFAVQTTKPS